MAAFGSVNRNAMHKQCWSLLLIGSLIVTFALMFSYWHFVPHQLNMMWSLFRNNGSEKTPAASEIKYFFPPEPVPEELNLKRGGPFIYQILH
ncbi:uncharacterized protein LOC117792075 [Drosophila innubila]|uniref:uncharacterized protein LOC117792075 n=1 Tax=Drosophila innubila TaxID=198719 RepID=UPI00148E8B55|nr:uncharacterized protein LOC117792075 [Drosophila innubila]